jgi:hypothetical protein
MSLPRLEMLRNAPGLSAQGLQQCLAVLKSNHTIDAAMDDHDSVSPYFITELGQLSGALVVPASC